MESDDLIGPVPVAAGAEAANASEAERFEEVGGIVYQCARWWACKMSDHRISATLQVGRILLPEATAYDILGVKQDATPAEMKKRSVLQFCHILPSDDSKTPIVL